MATARLAMLRPLALTGIAIVATTAVPTNLQLESAQLPIVGYFSNKAQYRDAPYTRNIADLHRIAHGLDAVIYGQFDIEDASFTIISRDSEDPAKSFPSLNNLRGYNSDIKILMSIGGPEVPSATWHNMAKTEAYREAFIASLKQYETDYGIDGIELDWDYPCSGRKVCYIQLTRNTFQDILDTGGECPEDYTNMAALLKDIRTAMGETFTITMTVHKDTSIYTSEFLSEISPYVDNFMVQAYGYKLSSDPNTGGSSVTAAFQPIEGSDLNDESASATSVNGAISALVAAGMDTSKMVMVVPAYGTTYYLPNEREWQKLGTTATKSGECFGPYEDTYGASVSDALHDCGVMSYQEIIELMAAEDAPQIVQDETTKADLAFLPSKTILATFTGPTAARSLVTAVQSQRLGGIAINSIDMDTFGGADDFQLTTETCKALLGAGERCSLTATTTTVSPPPGPPPDGGDCYDHIAGTYCVNSTAFRVCPNNVTVSCPAGTVCKQNDTHAIACDWPDFTQGSKSSFWSFW